MTRFKLFLLIAVLLGYATLAHADFFGSEVTVFPIRTTQKGTDALDRMIFTVFPERQEVVCTILSQNPILQKLHKCTVRDKENWVCEDSFTTEAMTGGNYGQNPPDPSVTYSNGWKWWFTKFKELYGKTAELFITIFVFGALIAWAIYCAVFPLGPDKNRALWSGELNPDIPTKLPKATYYWDECKFKFKSRDD